MALLPGIWDFHQQKTWGSKADNVLKYDGAGVSTVRTFTLAGCTTGLSTGDGLIQTLSGVSPTISSLYAQLTISLPDWDWWENPWYLPSDYLTI